MLPKTSESAEFTRRRVLQSAAWAAPLVAASVAAPALSASLPGSQVYLSMSGSSDTLPLLDEGNATEMLNATVNAAGFFIIYNPNAARAGALVDLEFTVAAPAEIPDVVGQKGRNFGVAEFDGIAVDATERSTIYQSDGLSDFGIPTTVFQRSFRYDIGGNGNTLIPFALGIAGTRSGPAYAQPNQVGALVSLQAVVDGGLSNPVGTSFRIGANAGLL